MKHQWLLQGFDIKPSENKKSFYMSPNSIAVKRDIKEFSSADFKIWDSRFIDDSEDSGIPEDAIEHLKKQGIIIPPTYYTYDKEEYIKVDTYTVNDDRMSSFEDLWSDYYEMLSYYQPKATESYALSFEILEPRLYLSDNFESEWYEATGRGDASFTFNRPQNFEEREFLAYDIMEEDFDSLIYYLALDPDNALDNRSVPNLFDENSLEEVIQFSKYFNERRIPHASPELFIVRISIIEIIPPFPNLIRKVNRMMGK